MGLDKGNRMWRGPFDTPPAGDVVSHVCETTSGKTGAHVLPTQSEEKSKQPAPAGRYD